MKKFLAILISSVLLLSLAACGDGTTQSNSSNIPTVSQNTESTVNEPVVESKDSTPDETITDEIKANTSNETIKDEAERDTPNRTENQIVFEGLYEIVSKDIEDTIVALNTEYEKLVTDIETYDKYLENTDRIEMFYMRTLEDTKNLCIRMREYSINYAESIMSSDKSNDDKYDDFEELLDDIYEDAGDEILDEIYDGVLDDMLDTFYDGILDDASDDAPYDEWSDARSNEYDWWSDTRSDVYDEWSDFRSDVYDFWSDMRGELWDDDIERAEDKIKDFQENVEKLKNNDTQGNNENSEQAESNVISSEKPENANPSEEPQNTNSSEELVDGMRLEFKEAMDSYEAFYNEYCDFLKRYNENSSDLKLLAEYADMMIKITDMNEKFEEWDSDEMNNAEIKYHLEVNNRVMQKLLEVSE